MKKAKDWPKRELGLRIVTDYGPQGLPVLEIIDKTIGGVVRVPLSGYHRGRLTKWGIQTVRQLNTGVSEPNA